MPLQPPFLHSGLNWTIAPSRGGSGGGGGGGGGLLYNTRLL